MSKRRLLLADDSVTIQKVVNLTFADEGIEVFTVGTGSAAIEKLMEVAPDVVLADVHMPGLNGYEVCEQVKQNQQFRDVPVILLVGSFEPFDEAEARRVGANDFLTKPFQSIRQLVQKVTDLLDRKNSDLIDIEASSSTAAPQTLIGGNSLKLETTAANGFSEEHETSEMSEQILTNTATEQVLEHKSDEQNLIREKSESTSELETSASNVLSDASADDDALLHTATTTAETTSHDEDSSPLSLELEPLEQSPTAADGNDLFEVDADDDENDHSSNLLETDFQEHPRESHRETELHQSNGNATADEGTAKGEFVFNPFAITDEDGDDFLDLKPEPSIVDNDKIEADARALSLSPEVIEAIAEQVAARLSDRVIDRIAWDKVPERFDSIIRRYVVAPNE